MNNYTYAAGSIEQANINKLMAERDVVIPWAQMPSVSIVKVGRGKSARETIRVRLVCDIDPTLFPSGDVSPFIETFAPVVMFSFRPGVMIFPAEQP